MGMTGWVESWQMQCCGEAFQVGSQVAWTLGNTDPDWLKTMLGTDAQPVVDAAEDSRVFYLVPGSGVLTDVGSADGWTVNRGDERFVGYLIQLEL